MLYFAYGSNLSPAQMQRRCPGARLVGTVVLDGYALTFAGRSSGWGGGVATIEPEPGARVHGAVYAITEEHLRSLDRAEGVPFAYVRCRRELQLAGNRRRPWCYIKQDAEPAMPTRSYFMRIVDGYRALGLPTDSLAEAVRRTAWLAG